MPKQRLAWILLALCASAARADDDSVSAERPDVVDSAAVVGKGRFQLETGALREIGADARTWSTPTLLRFGVGDTSEFRIETDGRIRSSAGGATVSGYGDWAASVKWHLDDGGNGGPALGLIVQADVDTGSPAFRGKGVRPSARGVAEWELADGWSADAMAGVMLDRRPDGGRFANGVLAAGLGKDLDERWHAFVELAAPTIAKAHNGGSNLSFDTGFSFLVSKRLVIDTAVMRGMNRNTPDWSWTAGLAAKF